MICEGKHQAEPAYFEEGHIMNSKCHCVILNDGNFIPVLGFGTALPLEVRPGLLGLRVQKK